MAEGEQVLASAAAQSWSLLLTLRPIDFKRKCSAAATLSLPFLGLQEQHQRTSLWLHPSIPLRSFLDSSLPVKNCSMNGSVQSKKNLLYPPLAGNSEHIQAYFSRNTQQKSPRHSQYQ